MKVTINIMFIVDCETAKRTHKKLRHGKGWVRDSATKLTLRRLQFKTDHLTTLMCLVMFRVNYTYHSDYCHRFGIVSLRPQPSVFLGKAFCFMYHLSSNH